MTTRKQVYIILFSISLIFALLGLSVVITLSAINQSFYSNINITYTATNNIVLNFANNEGTSINIDETSVVYSDDGSQFRIDGEVPTTSTLTRSGEVTNLDNLTNNNGAEFYYFSTNSNVLTDPQNTIWEEQDRFYISTEEDPIWYDAPSEIINLYSTFLTPNCYTGTQEDIGSNTDIIISHQVTTIPYNAFSDAMMTGSVANIITSIVLPNSVTNIESEMNVETGAMGGAFAMCTSLTSAIIPSSVEHIGAIAFMMCTGLASNTYDSGKYIGIEGNPYALLVGVTDYTISSIDIHDECISIQSAAFFDMINEQPCQNLTSVSIPSKVKNIGYGAFMQCTNLNSVTFEGESKLEEIGMGAFAWTLISSITIPDSITSIGDYAFSECSSLTSIVIPDSVTSIGDRAFSECSSLTSIVIPDSVTSIGYDAFENCSSLTSINIPDSVTSIGDYAFFGCSELTTVTIGENSRLTSIGDYAFSECSSLTSIVIPDSVTSIGSSAFYNCSSLTSITIPDSVTSIGGSAFYNCSNLTIYCEAVSQPSGWDSRWNSSYRPVYWAGEWEYDGEGNPVPIESVSANSLLVNANSTIYKSEDLDIVFIDRKKSA